MSEQAQKNDNFLFDNYKNFVNRIFYGDLKYINKILNEKNIFILDDFKDNLNIIKKFYDKFISLNKPKAVICGINPGRFGAGKTGIPFLDFSSISKLINDIDKNDTERSAQFFYSVIAHLTPDVFYKYFYVTNISCLGFKILKKQWKNINYYELPFEIQKVFINNFLNEINYLTPEYIISCSRQVHKTLVELKDNNLIKSNIDIIVQHPYWCSIDANSKFGFDRYIYELKKLIGPHK
jgi:hypothetical protein